MKFNRRDLLKVLGAGAVEVPNLSAVPEVDRLTTPPQPIQDHTPPCPLDEVLWRRYDDEMAMVCRWWRLQ